MGARGFLVFGVLVAVGFAGCVSSASEEGGGPAAVAASPAFDETTGSVTGSVLTDEILPIIGAQVGILGTTLVATVDETGRYTLNFVPPGRQTVSVIALGFLSGSKTVEVTAGAVLEKIDFVLTQLPSEGPYSFTEIKNLIVGGTMLKATPSCMYASQYGIPAPPGVSPSSMKTCVGTLNCESGPCEMHYGHCGDEGETNYGENSDYSCMFTNEWQTIVGEVMWTPPSGVNGRGWSWEVLAPNVTRLSGHIGSVDQSDLHDWWKLSSRAPIQTRIDRATALEGSPSGTAGNHPMVEEDLCGGHPDSDATSCDWAWRLFPGWCTINGLSGGLAGCEQTGPDFALDQNGVPATVYFSVFIEEPAEAGFTAVPDQ